MTAINVTPMEPGHFGVQVEEGDLVTSHRVRLTDGFVDDLLLDGVDPALIVRESFAVLLDRMPATSVPAELSLDEVERDQPGYLEELKARLAVS